MKTIIVSFLIRLAVFQARGGARMTLCLAETATKSNVEHPTSNIDGTVKSQKFSILSFRRKPESSNFIMFWMPDRVRHDEKGIFTNPSTLNAQCGFALLSLF
jgi:hypothetical protein